MKKQEQIVLLGAGNVAWHLARALHLLNVGETEYVVTDIYSPSGTTACDLASTLGEGVHSTNDLRSPFPNSCYFPSLSFFESYSDYPLS